MNRGKRAKKEKKCTFAATYWPDSSSHCVPFLRSLTPPFPSISHKYVLRCHSSPFFLLPVQLFFIHSRRSTHLTSLPHSTHPHSPTFTTTCLPTRSTVCRYHRDRLKGHFWLRLRLTDILTILDHSFSPRTCLPTGGTVVEMQVTQPRNNGFSRVRLGEMKMHEKLTTIRISSLLFCLH